MLHVVTGGSGSGKSEYAEQLITGCGPLRRFYIATMQVWEEEGAARVRRHRAMRREKGFTTVERYVDLSGLELADPGWSEEPAQPMLPGPPAAPEDIAVLLECMSNLAANEFYRDEEKAFTNIMEGIFHLRQQCRELVIVTNEVSSDGTGYSEETMRYIALLGAVNRRLGQMADTVTEVVYGIPVAVKQTLIE